MGIMSTVSETPFGILLFPVSERAIGYANHLAGLKKAGSGLYGFFDQLNVFTANRGADAYSSFSQIARTFFDRTIRAAASAKALSLRLSSF